jgi:hypothetical protein
VKPASRMLLPVVVAVSFISSFSPNASELHYGTCLGGLPEEQITSLDVEPDGTAWVMGFARANRAAPPSCSS